MCGIALTSKMDRERQLQILDKVMYDTTEVEYHGHYWNDIMDFFLPVHCYQINLNEVDVDIRENINVFYQILCQAMFEASAENNPYTKKSKNVWGKIFYEGSLSEINFKNLLMSYIALTWDITYLYLYQCLEDRFACEAVRPLLGRLNVDITESDLNTLLYEELSWQPRDLDGIEKILKKYPVAKGVSLLQELAGEENLSKYIYSLRNSIVHESKDARIPLNDNSTWENVIEGILYLLLET